MKTNLIAAFLTLIVFTSCQKTIDNPVVKNPNTAASAETNSALPPQLAKGVNLYNWFNDGSDPAQYANRFGSAYFALIKSLGFTYVRIPIGRSILFQPSNPSQLNPANLPYVDKAIDLATAAGLAVVIDYHPGNTYGKYESLLFRDASAINAFTLYWKAVAAYFTKYSPSQIFFEVYNEQHACELNSNPKKWQWWWPQQAKIVHAIREVTNGHYIIVAAEGWSNIGDLVSGKPYDETKIIYNFHFYQPFIFTHQGASWVNDAKLTSLRNVPYPSSPQNVAPLIAASSDPTVKSMLTAYGNSRFNAEVLDQFIKPVSEWAKNYNVPVMCDEFGVYKQFAPRDGRLQYLHDIRSILEKNNIGWCLWESDGGFGFINYGDGNRNNFIVDRDVVNALGL